MSHPCPECKEKGIEKVFQYPTGLGVHRRSVHGVLGTSNASIAARKAKAVAKNMAATKNVLNIACPYCPRMFDTANGRAKHIGAAHPGKGRIRRPLVVSASRDATDLECLAAFTAGQWTTECRHLADKEKLNPSDFLKRCADYFTKAANL